MNRIITLTTDFGMSEPFVGVMKGQILSRCVDANIIDLTHSITPYWPFEAGFWLSRSYQYFPRGSIHVAVVDPGVGTERQIVCAEVDGHVFLAPDNGLLSMLVAAARSQPKFYQLDLKRLQSLNLGAPSATFHGRDLFAPVAAELAAGRIAPNELGDAILVLAASPVADPIVEAGRVKGVIVTIDHFGNLISNIDSGRVRFKSAQVCIGTLRLALNRTYGDGVKGDYLALINSFGVLEIACVEGSAAVGLGLGRGSPIEVIEAG